MKGWIVDFSLAQRQGLESNLADKANFIRGCDVHYKRGVKKIADKVAEDEPSKSLFKKIAHSIPVSTGLIICYNHSVSNVYIYLMLCHLFTHIGSGIRRPR